MKKKKKWRKVYWISGDATHITLKEGLQDSTPKYTCHLALTCLQDSMKLNKDYIKWVCRWLSWKAPCADKRLV